MKTDKDLITCDKCWKEKYNVKKTLYTLSKDGVVWGQSYKYLCKKCRKQIERSFLDLMEQI